MDPNEFIRNLFIYVAVPALGIAVLFALASGKVKTAGFGLLALVLGAAFVFMPGGTIQQIGASAASGLSAFLNR